MGALLSTAVFHCGADQIEMEENSFFDLHGEPIDQNGVLVNLGRLARRKKAILVVNVASK